MDYMEIFGSLLIEYQISDLQGCYKIYFCF